MENAALSEEKVVGIIPRDQDLPKATDGENSPLASLPLWRRVLLRIVIHFERRFESEWKRHADPSQCKWWYWQ